MRVTLRGIPPCLNLALALGLICASWFCFFERGIATELLGRGRAPGALQPPSYEEFNTHTQEAPSVPVAHAQSGVTALYTPVRLAPTAYSCEDLIVSIQQEWGTYTPTLAHFATFVHSISENPSADADKTAATALGLVDPLREGELSHDMWLALFYGCTLKGEPDTVLQRVYRCGLVRTARVLREKGFYGLGQYLYPRDAEGNNLLHLAVISGNPELIDLLGDTLHAHSMHLLAATNKEGETPRALAQKRRSFGCVDALENLHNAYKHDTASLPELPPPPQPPVVPPIQLIKKHEMPGLNGKAPADNLRDSKFQHFSDLTHIRSKRSAFDSSELNSNIPLVLSVLGIVAGVILIVLIILAFVWLTALKSPGSKIA